MSEDQIYWHPAFVKAFELELDEYLNILEITSEYQLTTKPLEIDVLVIKKLKDVKILKNIAGIFKGNNIVEYKSPEDYLSIDDYYKVKAYVYIYKSSADKADGIKIDDLTITLVSSSFPKKMAAHLKKFQKVDIEAVSEGIYYVKGDDIDTQIIVVDELPKKENRYIRLLSRRLNIKDELTNLINEYAKNPKDTRFELLFDTMFSSNVKQILEVLEMAKTLTYEEQDALERVVSKFKLDTKWMNKGLQQGKAEGKAEEARALLSRLAARKFGSMPESLVLKFNSLDSDTVEKIVDKIFEINSLEDLEKYIN